MPLILALAFRQYPHHLRPHGRASNNTNKSTQIQAVACDPDLIHYPVVKALVISHARHVSVPLIGIANSLYSPVL